MVTASADGWIKGWDVRDVLSFDSNIETSPIEIEIAPSFRFSMIDVIGSKKSQSHQISSLESQLDAWIVFLRSGGILKFPIPCLNGVEMKSHPSEWLWDFPSGKIAGIDVFRKGNCFVTVSEDGTVCLYDIR